MPPGRSCRSSGATADRHVSRVELGRRRADRHVLARGGRLRRRGCWSRRRGSRSSRRWNSAPVSIVKAKEVAELLLGNAGVNLPPRRGGSGEAGNFLLEPLERVEDLGQVLCQCPEVRYRTFNESRDFARVLLPLNDPTGHFSVRWAFRRIAVLEPPVARQALNGSEVPTAG